MPTITMRIPAPIALKRFLALPPILPVALALMTSAAVPLWAQWDDGEGWSEVKSPHFTIFTNARPERGQEIAYSLELFRAAFARLAPELELRSPAPTKILAFRDARSYAPYKGRRDDGNGRVLGQFISHPDGNYLTLDADTERLVGSFAVVYHEYVHYFVRHNLPGVPLWFNEGLAEYYSTFAVENRTVYLGRPVKRHLRWLERDGEMDLGEVLEVTRKSPAYQEGRKAGRFYAVSWVLVHYLLSGDDQRLGQMADFLVRLNGGADVEEAFERAFDVRLRHMEDTLRAHVVAVAAGEFPAAALAVEELNNPGTPRVVPLAPADALFHLGDLLVHSRQPQAAEAHFELALDLRSEHAPALAGLGLVRDLDGRLDEAEILFRDAVSIGSNDPLTYLLYGRHLLLRLQESRPEDGRAQELGAAARAAFTTVTQLDRDFAEGWALLGLAHLTEGVDPAPGILALGRARSLMPLRSELVFHLARLHLKNRAYDVAERLVEQDLTRRADDEWLFKAREEISRTRLLDAAQVALDGRDFQRAMSLFDEAVSLTSDPELRSRMEDRLRALQEKYDQ